MSQVDDLTFGAADDVQREIVRLVSDFRLELVMAEEGWTVRVGAETVKISERADATDLAELRRALRQAGYLR